MTDNEKEAVSHALADDDAQRPWTCACDVCIEYRKTTSPELMDCFVAFEKLNRAERRLDHWKTVIRPALEKAIG